MPTYEYGCAACGTHTTARRLFGDREKPEPCPACGEPAEVLFTPSSNIYIPLCQTAEYGLNWSDVHGDLTEKDLAKIEGVEQANHAMSQPKRKHSVSKPVSQSTLA